jgi:hypothetical protein
MRVSSVFAAASLVLVAVSATACSSGQKTAAATRPASAGTTAASASSATGNAAASSSVTNFNVCKALPAAAASQITGTTFTTTKPDDLQGVIFSCEYDGSGGALLQISVTTKGGTYGLDTDVSALKTVGHPPTLISGVGDKAFSEPDPKGNAGSVGASSFASFGALFGDVYIQVGGLTYVTADQGKQIVEELHSKL